MIGSLKDFNRLVTQMIMISEGTGAFDAMLAKISEFYEKEVDTGTDGGKAQWASIGSVIDLPFSNESRDSRITFEITSFSTTFSTIDIALRVGAELENNVLSVLIIQAN
ncbi:hypothetical protein [Neobacillus cucumis]